LLPGEPSATGASCEEVSVTELKPRPWALCREYGKGLVTVLVTGALFIGGGLVISAGFDWREWLIVWLIGAVCGYLGSYNGFIRDGRGLIVLTATEITGPGGFKRRTIARSDIDRARSMRRGWIARLLGMAPRLYSTSGRWIAVDRKLYSLEDLARLLVQVGLDDGRKNVDGRPE
jgi:hypothetical protein